jgi:sec-independent protein translocase protein TatB
MFDITSSKLLILAIVALIVVGPKDLPILLRTVGKYLGVIRRHANEFRAQLDEVMREAELQELRKEFEDVGREVKATMDEGARAIDTQVANAGMDDATKKVEKTPAPLTPVPDAAETKSVSEPPDNPQLPEKTGT